MTDMQVYDNPYDPTNPDFQSQTPPLDVVIREAIAAALRDVFICRPAVITAVTKPQQVNIQILLQARYTTGSEPYKLPIIPNVMVMMPMGANYSIKLPLAVGDTGLALFSDRSLDGWSNSTGGFVDPADVRSHAIPDAIFIPGLIPFPNQLTDATSDMILTNGKAQVNLNPAGTFKFGANGQDLIQNLTNLVQTLTTASTVAGGPFTADVVETLTQIGVNLKALQES